MPAFISFNYAFQATEFLSNFFSALLILPKIRVQSLILERFYFFF
jgi:hypothetical protein